MVQINSSAVFVVAVIATNALAAPTLVQIAFEVPRTHYLIVKTPTRRSSLGTSLDQHFGLFSLVHFSCSQLVATKPDFQKKFGDAYTLQEKKGNSSKQTQASASGWVQIILHIPRTHCLIARDLMNML